MEIHRLTPMKPYDHEQFNRLYQECQPLLNKLSNGIDPRRYGVSKDIIRSWFDDKFIFVYNKYQDDPSISEKFLKGHLLRSLMTFKLRVLRVAYQSSIYQNMLSMDSVKTVIFNIPDEKDMNMNDLFLDMVMEYMKANLSYDAFNVLQVDLNPPPYILARLEDGERVIPAGLICEFMGWDSTNDNIEYVESLRLSIKKTVKSAKEDLNKKPIAMNS